MQQYLNSRKYCKLMGLQNFVNPDIVSFSNSLTLKNAVNLFLYAIKSVVSSNIYSNCETLFHDTNVLYITFYFNYYT